MKQMGYEQTSSFVREAIRDQVECVGPSSEISVKIAESLGWRSNQEILIEAVALQKLKENAEQGTPGDAYVFPHYSRNQPMSPESTRSTGSPGTNWISSSGMYHEGASPLHPHSTSEGSLLGIIENEQGLDMTKMSLASSEERSDNLEENNMDLIHYSVSPSRTEVSNAGRANEPPLTQDHSRKASASCQVANENQSDANDSSELSNHLTSYSTDNYGDVKGESYVSFVLNATHREPEHSPCLIEAWSRSQTIRQRPSDRLVPQIVSSHAIETRTDLSDVETQVRKLVEDLKSDSVDTQRTATAELRLLAKHTMDNRIVIANSGAIIILVNLLRSADTKIQENAVTALLNLSLNDNNKTAIANADAIEPLIHVLETGSSEGKENAAATLFSLSVMDDIKVRIGRFGAIRPLVDLLGNGTPRGKKDAAAALFNLSMLYENKARMVQVGAVKHLVELMDPATGMIDKAVAVLANLATIHEGRIAIGQEGGIPVLVEVVEVGSARGKEHAAAALLQLCTNSGRFCNTVLQEGAVPPLVVLSQSGTPRAKEKAHALLLYFRNQRHGNARG